MTKARAAARVIAPSRTGEGEAHRLALSDLERALLVLSVDERELLLLIGVDGLPQDTLADMLGIEAPALRQRVTRARARLARELEICQTGTDLRRGRR